MLGRTAIDTLGLRADYRLNDMHFWLGCQGVMNSVQAGREKCTELKLRVKTPAQSLKNATVQIAFKDNQ